MLKKLLSLFKCTEPEPKPFLDFPLPEGKLYKVPCGNCGKPAFYYTHNLYPEAVPVYQHVIKLDGELVSPKEVPVPFTEVLLEDCCGHFRLPVLCDVTIVDNPFYEKESS